ncbi:DUF4304 domain-containing protein [Mycolicibacterium fortuitum]|uniref:DUF4304 domain-containing protein n=1 Tax=Mycolicibacterium fortuitum TaxID=1766 RepID=UPI0013F4D636|nr:DUF4304 domain-containing protein [Mycolicibacterium fortuitum]
MSNSYLSPAAQMRRTLDQLLSQQVRPVLKQRGFTKSGRRFLRQRGPLYDLIDVQGSKWNAVTPHHGFFVNVGVGSTEIDAVYRNPSNPSRPEYVLYTRWETLLPGMPRETAFDQSTDMVLFAELFIGALRRLLDVIDPIDSSPALAQWAVQHNLLNRMEKVCAYLAACDDLDTLAGYVSKIRQRLADDRRWPTVNRHILDALGPVGPAFIEQGLLDPSIP